MPPDPLSSTFAALADPTRRAILARLASGDCTVGELAAPFEISLPAVSKHLRILRDNGFVQARVDGQRRMYRVDPKAFVEVDDWLEPYRRLWEDRLDSLQRYLESVQPDEAKYTEASKQAGKGGTEDQ